MSVQQTHPSQFDRASIHRLPRHVLLREFRRRIDPGVHRLGPYERLPLKRGRRVTQEELADAIGISRVWYSVLESSNANIRPSTTLVDRVASVLAISSVERVALFYAAIPELRTIAQAS
jgi:hypothetical protein